MTDEDKGGGTGTEFKKPVGETKKPLSEYRELEIR